MAQGAMTVAVQTNFSRDNGQRRRLAFRAIHGLPFVARASKTAKKQPEEKFTLIFPVLVFQQLICKIERESLNSAIYRRFTFTISNIF
jgi:hypothetical protein